MGLLDPHYTEKGALNAIIQILGTNTVTTTPLSEAATSLAVIDDWDESDRAKVNTIVGQAGVAAGAGAVSANTQRVTLTTEQEAILSSIYTATNASQAAVVTSVALSSTDTTFVDSTGIDLDSYRTISFVPNVTTAAGTNAYYRIQWSFDNTNWFDETIDVAGTIAGSPAESAITQGTMIRSVLSGSTGYKPLSSITLTKKARYIRISQRSDGAVTIGTTYNYQLLK